MTERTTRTPYDHALHLINTVGQSTDRMAVTPDGRPRDLDGPTATALLIATSNAAIASALLAIDATLRAQQERP